MIITIERWVNVLPELVPLFVNHWKEVETKAHEELNPNWNLYLELDAQGVYALCVARVEGEIVGYIGDIVHTSLHYQTLHAVNDFMYVKPHLRKSDCFKKMMRCIEDHEKRMGVTTRFMNFKDPGRDYGKYRAIERVMIKRLGD